MLLLLATLSNKGLTLFGLHPAANPAVMSVTVQTQCHQNALDLSYLVLLCSVMTTHASWSYTSVTNYYDIPDLYLFCRFIYCLVRPGSTQN